MRSCYVGVATGEPLIHRLGKTSSGGIQRFKQFRQVFVIFPPLPLFDVGAVLITVILTEKFSTFLPT